MESGQSLRQRCRTGAEPPKLIEEYFPCVVKAAFGRGRSRHGARCLPAQPVALSPNAITWKPRSAAVPSQSLVSTTMKLVDALLALLAFVAVQSVDGVFGVTSMTVLSPWTSKPSKLMS